MSMCQYSLLIFHLCFSLLQKHFHGLSHDFPRRRTWDNSTTLYNSGIILWGVAMASCHLTIFDIFWHILTWYMCHICVISVSYHGVFLPLSLASRAKLPRSAWCQKRRPSAPHNRTGNALNFQSPIELNHLQSLLPFESSQKHSEGMSRVCLDLFRATWTILKIKNKYIYIYTCIYIYIFEYRNWYRNWVVSERSVPCDAVRRLRGRSSRSASRRGLGCWAWPRQRFHTELNNQKENQKKCCGDIHVIMMYILCIYYVHTIYKHIHTCIIMYCQMSVVPEMFTALDSTVLTLCRVPGRDRGDSASSHGGGPSARLCQ